VNVNLSRPLLAVLLIVGCCAFTAGAAQAQQSQPPPTIASAVDAEISAVEKRVLEAAEAMPADKFDFSPESLNIPGSDYRGVRTFALQIKHIAASNNILWSPLTGENLPEDFKGGNGPASVRTRAEVLQFLKNSFALGHRAAATLTPQNMLETPGASKSSRLHLAEFGVAHAYDHYGQMVEYLRMNGIVPPATAQRAQQQSPEPPQASSARIVDLKASDGTALKASYFAAGKPGPGVLLFHQSNRTRKSWDDVATQLAAAGISALSVDMRGFGDTGGTPVDKRTPEESAQARERRPGDLDTAFQYLISQPGVQRDLIGIGGAGVIGVENSVETAQRHSASVKSLVLLSGETDRSGLEFLRQASQLPELFVAADDDEYPPTTEAMELLYITSSNSGRKFVHYSAARDAPWLWYEPFDIGKVPSTGNHGADLFQLHPELPGIIVDWFVTTLIKTPGHAPAETVACAPILNEIATGGVAQATRQLTEARRKDPQAQLFPEITASTIGQDYMRVHDAKSAVEVFRLILVAYPDSADANENLGEAYLAAGDKEQARRYAEKTLALLDSHSVPASSWTDTEPYRGEIRRGAEDTLKKLGETPR
jgi:dienelactone hydrolase